jgi:hypothetical protein
MHIVTKLVLAASAVMAFVMPADAATITFDNLSAPTLSQFTSYSEDGFTIAAGAGEDVFRVANIIGNPAPDIFLGGFIGKHSASVDITADNGGLFSIDSFDVLAIALANSYKVSGFLGATETTILDSSASGLAFQTVLTGSAQQFDRVNIAFSIAGIVIPTMRLDNINLSVAAVPEPATWAMMMLGLAGVGAALRRRRSQPAYLGAAAIA